MHLPVRGFRNDDICDELRIRRHGYQLRCLEPVDHDGPHRWTPELVDTRNGAGTRPPIARATASAVERIGRMLG
jgi:hypothetical protein